MSARLPQRCVPCSGTGLLPPDRGDRGLRYPCDACRGTGFATICEDCGGVIALSREQPGFISLRLHILDDCTWTKELQAAGEWVSPPWEAAVRARMAGSAS